MEGKSPRLTLQPPLLTASYILSGATLKAADYTGEKGDFLNSFLSAAASGVILGWLTSESVFSSSLILGLVLGVAAAKKVDRVNMIFGLVLTLVSAIFFQFKPPSLWLLVYTAFFSLVDEVGHDRMGGEGGFLAIFFRYRLVLKVALTLLAVSCLIPLTHLTSFLGFDVSYDLTGYLLNEIKRD